MLWGIGMYTRKPLPRGFPSFFLFCEVMEEKKMAKTCNNCVTENQSMNVPYVVHEATVARQERQIKRMWIALIVAIAMLFASNIGWLIYENQFETVETNETVIEATQDGEGINIVGGGDINYDSESKDNQENN